MSNCTFADRTLDTTIRPTMPAGAMTLMSFFKPSAAPLSMVTVRKSWPPHRMISA